MTISVRSNIQDARPVLAEFLHAGLPAEAAGHPATTTSAYLSAAELAFPVFAAFRAHPHISNVLTHISNSNWPQVERALNVILDPAGNQALSPLAENIVDLMCAERGITGRIIKPYFHGVLERLAGPQHKGRLIRHIDALFAGIECRAQRPPAAPVEPVEGSLP